MTIDELIQKRRNQLQSIIERNIPFQRAVLTTVNHQSKRIFIDGINSSGSSIGQYDVTRQMYINPNKSPRKTASKPQGIQGLLPTVGKTGKHIFKSTGKEHKTTFVNNYKEFRNRIGRRIDFVNLNLSGELKSDFDSGNPQRISPHEYHVSLKRDGDMDKLRGNEKRFGKIFNLTSTEKEIFLETLNKELQLALA